MGFQKGNTHGPRFTSENQPPPDVKTHGRQRSFIARQMLDLLVKVDIGTQAELKKSYPDLAENLSTEELMTLMQINRAIIHADTRAYNAVLNSAYGQAMQPHEFSGPNGGPIEKKIDYSALSDEELEAIVQKAEDAKRELEENE